MPRGQLRQRAACVRCHSQKLRCPERRGEERNCARCIKAGAQCVFGISMRGLRSQLPLGFELRTADEMDVDVAGKKKSHFTKALHAPDDIRDAVEVDAFPFNDDVGAGYTTDAQVLQSQSETFDNIVENWNCNPDNIFPGFEMMDAPIYPRPNAGNANMAFQESFVQDQSTATTASAVSQSSILSDSETHGTSESSRHRKNRTSVLSAPKSAHECIKNLSKLSLDLYEHAAMIPPISTQLSSPNQRSKDSSNIGGQNTSNHVAVDDEIRGTEEFPIDDTFHLTTALLDIICYLDMSSSSTSSRPGSVGLLIDSPTMHRQQDMATSHESIVKSSGDAFHAPRNSSYDHATILLVVSCYTRLMDIYECLFGHIKACVEHAVLPVNQAGHVVTLPAVKVGSYQVSSASAIPLQVMTILQLSASIGNGLQGLLDKVELSSRSSEGRPCNVDGNMMETVCKDVKYRSIDVSKKTRLIWKILYQSGLL